jgi:hypothetical protein
LAAGFSLCSSEQGVAVFSVRLPALQASEAAALTPVAWLAARQGRTLRQVT